MPTFRARHERYTYDLVAAALFGDGAFGFIVGALNPNLNYYLQTLILPYHPQTLTYHLQILTLDTIRKPLSHPYPIDQARINMVQSNWKL